MEQQQNNAVLNYSRQACMLTCEMDYMEQLCGCHRPRLHRMTKTCTEKTELSCLFRFIESRRSYFIQSSCVCPVQCTEVDYTPSTSFSPFATYFSAEILNVSEQHVSSNLLMLDIYFNELREKQVVSTPAYTFVELMADIGGSLSLFLGSGLFTIFELIDFAIVSVHERSKERKENSKTDFPLEEPALDSGVKIDSGF